MKAIKQQKDRLSSYRATRLSATFQLQVPSINLAVQGMPGNLYLYIISADKTRQLSLPNMVTVG